MKYLKKKKKRKYEKYIPIIVSCLALTALAVLGMTAARYITQIDSGYKQADSNNFFFGSDLLTQTEGTSYSQVCAGLEDAAITFELHNYQDELNYSKEDIQYSVRYKLRSQENYVEHSTGTLIGNSLQEAKVVLPLRNLNPTGSTATVDVEVVSTAPYTQTLTASFTLTEAVGEAKIKVNDQVNSNVAMVYVTTGYVGGLITITVPEGCVPDPTADITINGNTVTFQANAKSECSFVCFKKDPSQVYTESNFTFTLS